MIGKGSAIPEFIERITEVSQESAERDREILLARLRVDHPDATAIDGVDYPYYEELVRKEQYDVDAQVVRTYFDFTRVRAGPARRDRAACSTSPTPPSTTRWSGTRT